MSVTLALALALLPAAAACGSEPAADRGAPAWSGDGAGPDASAAVSPPAAGDAGATDASDSGASSCASPCVAPAAVCARGACLEPAPTEEVDRELCGVHAYAGTWRVRAGVSITCATGELVVDADDVVIEPGASVSVAPTSTLGSGRDARACLNFGDTYYSGASGGGHGSLGQPGGEGYAGGNASNQCSSCSPTLGGPMLGSLEDALVEPGARGGNGCAGGGSPTGCPATNVLRGGRGGGVIRLLAQATLRIGGSVRAEGESGEIYGVLSAPRSGGAGGGSGGGVLLRGASVEVAAGALVSTAGGAGSAGYVLQSCLSVGPFNSKGGGGSTGRVKIVSPTAPPLAGDVIGALTLAR